MAEAEDKTAQPARSVAPMAERILIVEDDDSIATNLARALSAYGYSSTRSANGADALALTADTDLVLLDLGLPDIDGLEVCRHIRQADRRPSDRHADGARRRRSTSSSGSTPAPSTT